MTIYKRSDRRHWRYTMRRVAWRVNLLLATLALLAVVWLAQAGAVSAYPMNCRDIPHGQICRSSVDGIRLGRCDRGYQMMANWTCQRLAVQP